MPLQHCWNNESANSIVAAFKFTSWPLKQSKSGLLNKVKGSIGI